MSLTRTLLDPIISLLLTLSQALTYIVPSSTQRRISNIFSVYHQLLNLVIGRLLPDLPPLIPNTNLGGKTAIVSGSNSGIGQQIALDLCRRGATVVLACRSESRGEAALQHILWNVPTAKGRVSVLKLDTSSLASVKEFAINWANLQSSLHPLQGERKLDILVHNAGISQAPPNQELTDDGIEMLYATNFLGSFLLTFLLEPYLSGDARVVLTSSTGQLSARFKETFSLGPVRGVCEPGFHTAYSKVPVLGWERVGSRASARYAMTKGMQCAFARMLQRRWDGQVASTEDGKKRTAHAFTPGFTFTPIFGKLGMRSGAWLSDLLRDPAYALLTVGTALATDVEQGAATGTWLACTRDPAVVYGGGGYWDRLSREFSVADKLRDEVMQRLWTRWERDCGIEWT